MLLNIQSEANGSTLEIAKAVKKQLQQLRQQLPPDMHLRIFYDQSIFVRDSVSSVWDAIVFGLILSVTILYCFLKSWGKRVDGHRHDSDHGIDYARGDEARPARVSIS